MKQVIHTDKAPAAIGPYSQAIQIGQLLFTSGQVPIDPETGAIVEGGIQEQARQSLNNIKAILNAAGTNMGAVVKTTVFLQDMNDFAAMNEVYAQFFQEPYPARSAVQVGRLPKDALVEIEAIAQLEGPILCLWFRSRPRGCVSREMGEIRRIFDKTLAISPTMCYYKLCVRQRPPQV